MESWSVTPWIPASDIYRDLRGVHISVPWGTINRAKLKIVYVVQSYQKLNSNQRIGIAQQRQWESKLAYQNKPLRWSRPRMSRKEKGVAQRYHEREFLKRELFVVLVLLLLTASLGLAFYFSNNSGQETVSNVATFLNYVQSISSLIRAISILFDMFM